ncbi:MAG: phosphoribosylamine--glycine ligase [Proteobacteria bacterium]|nr:phosphoribosylamine--glycine ligase [Pseudomonadota bacterium]MCP4916931.1 phosphoribosylamine--glycine ligase [Pseudomonadota bacterium]
MNVLVVGGGGREAALAWKLAESAEVWVTNPGPGFPDARALPAGEISEQAQLAGIDLVVVGPEAPLVDGLVDRCQARGIPAFGPSAKAARLEASKGFAKDFMARHDIPTAGYGHFDGVAAAHAFVTGRCVVKADGLAAGKGVFMCPDEASARAAVNHVFDAGIGGGEVVIEEWLDGEELSVLALCDGERFVLLPAAQDHKRRFDGDRGPNTGGMGAYAPAPLGTPELLEQVGRDVIEPVLRGMAAEGAPFRGVLYAGLMVGSQGPKVLEFNVRFGDPECQPVLMLLDEPLAPILLACAEGRLEQTSLATRDGSTCCVVLVSDGYPGTYPKGRVITGLDAVHDDVITFQAGTRFEGEDIVTNGGRVLGVTAWGADIRVARDRAYKALETIHFDGAQHRTDIAGRALARLENT